MISPQQLDSFVARFMANLPDSLKARKEDLTTLLTLLPKKYSRRDGVIKALEAIRAHENTQLEFQSLLNQQSTQHAK